MTVADSPRRSSGTNVYHEDQAPQPAAGAGPTARRPRLGGGRGANGPAAGARRTRPGGGQREKARGN